MAITGVDGRWIAVNDALIELTGYGRDDLLRLSYQGITHPEDLSIDAELMVELASGRRAQFELRKRLLHARGHVIWIDLWVCALRDEHGHVTSYLSQSRDVTDRIALERTLKIAEERARRMFDDAPIGIVTATRDRRFVRVNDAFCAMTGYRPEELVGRSIASITHADDRMADSEHHVRLARESEAAVREKRYVRPDGSSVWVAVSTSHLEVPHIEEEFFAYVIDITDRRSHVEALELVAGTDPLTGLPNRRRFDLELARHGAAVAREGARGSVLMIDLDGLKEINDRRGHAEGDEALRAAGAALVASIRSGDTVARLGGDEFAVLAPDAGADVAVAMANRIVQAIERRTSSGSLTASVGVAEFRNEDDETGLDPLARADQALYAAKRAGGNRIAVAELGVRA